MGKIEVLDKHLINQIAAGEVIERPSSVVKELVENSIDSGATKIIVEIKNAGKDLISITDDGEGMSTDDAKKSIIKHATSKIKNTQDLFNIYTMGFRGEALASIASISKLQIITKDKSHVGLKLDIEDSKIKKQVDFPREHGTTINVQELFYNTPARLKYLRDNYIENSNIIKSMQNYVLIHPEIHFELIINDKTIIKAPSANSKNNLLAVYDTNYVKNFIEISGEKGDLKVNGFISKPHITRNNRNEINIFFNKRPVKNSLVNTAIADAYHNLLFNKSHPICVLNIEIDNKEIDVNVHPQKKEIRVKCESELYELIFNTLRKALEESNLTKSVKLDQRRLDGTKVEKKNFQKYTYESMNTDFNLENEVGEEKKYKAEQHDLSIKKDIKERFNTQTHSSQEELTVFEEEEDFEYDYETAPSNENLNLEKQEKDYLGINKHLYSKINNDEDVEKEFLNYINTYAKLNNKESYTPAGGIKVIGQFHNSFILAQDDKGMLIIDQHVAEERYFYEKFMDQYFSKGIEKQELLNASAISLTPEEHNFVINNVDNFANLGIEIEDFGNNQIKIRTLPIIFNKLQNKNFFFALLEDLQKETIFKANRKKNKHEFETNHSNDNFNLIDEIKEKIITKMACMTSLKAGEQLTISKMQDVVNKWNETKNKNTCPHGRPIQIRLNFADIWKQFKRDG